MVCIESRRDKFSLYKRQWYHFYDFCVLFFSFFFFCAKIILPQIFFLLLNDILRSLYCCWYDEFENNFFTMIILARKINFINGKVMWGGWKHDMIWLLASHPEAIERKKKFHIVHDFSWQYKMMRRRYYTNIILRLKTDTNLSLYRKFTPKW